MFGEIIDGISLVIGCLLNTRTVTSKERDEWIASLTPSELHAYVVEEKYANAAYRSANKYMNREMYDIRWNPDQVDPPTPPWIIEMAEKREAKEKENYNNRTML